MEFNKIRNIIFDLGAVIINIDIESTILAFAKHFQVPIEEIHTFLQEKSLWEEHEKGNVSDEILIQHLNSYFKNQIDETDFVKAWNTLLLDIPQERIELLKLLSAKYRLFLLSNTNQTHIDMVNEKLRNENQVVGGLDSLFERVYLSHQVKLRKPDPKIYEFVLNDSSLIATECLFLDDNEQNIISAASVGINTIHVTPNRSITELLAQA
ncbi:MAG: HAD family hydrolase [Cytophagales bacterium]